MTQLPLNAILGAVITVSTASGDEMGELAPAGFNSPGWRFSPIARGVAALAITGLLAGLGAAILGYVALKTLQDILGIPAVAPPICSVLGAIGGCRLAFRLVPPGWFPGESEQ